MVKFQITITLEGDLLKKVEDFKEQNYKWLSRSAVIELLLRESLKGRDISVVG